MQKYDVVIIGAGINGVGSAEQLALAGLKVAVIEKGTIGCGTSSKSSRLVHGGLRYLETYHFSLVHEALNDRARLAERFPELVQLIPFYLPVYASSPRPAWMIRLGLLLYDLLSYGKQPKWTHSIPVDEFKRLFSCLKSERLKAVYAYYDGKTHDLELTRSIANEAARIGVSFHEGTLAEKVVFEQDCFRVQTNMGDFTCATLINATGAWIDEVNEHLGLPAGYHITKVSGIHIEIPRLLVPYPMFLQTEGKRIFFMIPEDVHTIIGTTERIETLPVDEVTVQEEDIQYLLNHANDYLKEPLKRSDVSDAWIGVRPLIENKSNPSDISREYRLEQIETGSGLLIHVFGGKLTTFPSLAEKVAEAVLERHAKK